MTNQPVYTVLLPMMIANGLRREGVGSLIILGTFELAGINQFSGRWKMHVIGSMNIATSAVGGFISCELSFCVDVRMYCSFGFHVLPGHN